MRHLPTQASQSICLAALLLSGCNARVIVVSVNSDFTQQQPTPKSAARPLAGVWEGQNESSDGRSVDFTAYVLPSGAFWARAVTQNSPNVSACVLLLAGTIGGSVQLVYADPLAQRALPPMVCRFVDGSRRASGAVEFADGAFAIAAITESGANISTTYGTAADRSYDAPSTFASLVGTWTNEMNGGAEVVHADGTFTMHDPASGCTFSGALSVIDPARALYGLSEIASDCADDANILNGQPLVGVALVSGTTIMQLAASERAIVFHPTNGNALLGM